MNKLKRFKNVLFITMIPPNHQKVCNSVDDYFDLIKYCWECIGDVKTAILGVNFYREYSQYEMLEYKKSIQHLHIRINECYKYLKELGNNKKSEIDTSVNTARRNFERNI